MNVSYSEAKKIAKIELEKYSQRVNIPIEDFSPPKIASDSQFQWSIIWETKNYPKHFLYVSIDHYGTIDRSRFIEKKPTTFK